MTDPFDLDRFIAAQDAGGTFARAMHELEHGKKTSHWMWFIFPQIQGLGRSPMAVRYAIDSLEEAKAYAAHPTLGARLRHCVAALMTLPSPDPDRIFGPIDAMKLRSSLTLFVRAVPDEPAFRAALDRYFGAPDPATDRVLANSTSPT
jgi:uncharacterized protein (DUF1810 family)